MARPCRTSQPGAGRSLVEGRADEGLTLLDSEFHPSRACRSITIRVARKIEFCEPDQADLGRPVPSEKIFRFSFTPNQRHRSRILLHRGALAIVTNVGAGCDGRGGCERRTRLMRTVKAYGPDAPTLASSSREAGFSGVTAAKKPGRRGEYAHTPLKPTRAGMPGVSAYPW